MAAARMLGTLAAHQDRLRPLRWNHGHTSPQVFAERRHTGSLKQRPQGHIVPGALGEAWSVLLAQCVDQRVTPLLVCGWCRLHRVHDRQDPDGEVAWTLFAPDRTSLSGRMNPLKL